MAASIPSVLVVDDEPNLRDVLKTVLEMSGYRATLVPDGETALCVVGEREIDVVLLDLVMPGMGGQEVCREIRVISPRTKVIYFTAKAGFLDGSETPETLGEGDAVIRKPATSAEILSKIRRVLAATK